MNCSRCRNLIDDYVANSLNGDELDDFVMHVLHCESCMDELKINYSLLTALNQLDRGDELSEDYDFEVEQQIKKYVERKKRNKYIKRATYAVLFVLSVCMSFLLLLFTTEKKEEEETVVYLAEGEKEKCYFNIEGVPEYLNPVKQKVYEYNDRVIEFLHSEKGV